MNTLVGPTGADRTGVDRNGASQIKPNCTKPDRTNPDQVNPTLLFANDDELGEITQIRFGVRLVDAGSVECF